MKCEVSWCDKVAKPHRPYCAAHHSLTHQHPEYTPDEMAAILADHKCWACHAPGARYWRYSDGPFGYRVCKSCHDVERDFLAKGIVPTSTLNLMRCAWAVGGSELDNEHDLRSYLCQLAAARNVGHSCPLCEVSADAPPANLPTTDDVTPSATQAVHVPNGMAQPSSVSVSAGSPSSTEGALNAPGAGSSSEMDASIWTTWRQVPYTQRTQRATKVRGAIPRPQRPMPEGTKHGTIWAYQRGCRCDECRARKRTENAKYNPRNNARRSNGGAR